MRVVVVEKIASLEEVETKWTLCQLFDVIDALDIQAEIQLHYKKSQEGKS